MDQWNNNQQGYSQHQQNGQMNGGAGMRQDNTGSQELEWGYDAPLPMPSPVVTPPPVKKRSKKWVPWVVAAGVLTILLPILVGVFLPPMIKYKRQAEASKQAALQSNQSKNVIKNKTSEPVSEPASEPAKEYSVDEALGEIKGNVYYNYPMGMKYTLPDNWSFADEAKMEELNANIKAVFNTEETQQYREALESGETIYAAYAAADDHSANFTVTVGQLDEASKEAFAKLEESYIEESAVDASISSVEEMYNQIGVKVYSIEKGYIKISGEDKVALKSHIEIDGIEQYQVSWMYYRNGYSFNAVIGTYSEDNTDMYLPYAENLK